MREFAPKAAACRSVTGDNAGVVIIKVRLDAKGGVKAASVEPDPQAPENAKSRTAGCLRRMVESATFPSTGDAVTFTITFFP